MPAPPTVVLPAETRIVTRWLAPLPLSGRNATEGWDEAKIAKRLAKSPSANAALALKRAKLGPPDFDPGAFWNAPEVRVEAWAIAELAVSFELVVEETLEEEREVSATDLAEHWWPAYDAFGDLQKAAFEGSPLAKATREWETPLTFVVPPDWDAFDAEGALAVFRAAVSEVPEAATEVRSTDGVGAMTWDGFVMALRRDPESLDALTSLMRAVCVDWHAQERAAARVRALLKKERTEGGLDELRRAVARFHHTLAVLEPTLLAYQESDMLFLDAAWNAWRRERLHQRTSHLLAAAEDAYRHAVDAQTEDRQSRLNRYIEWLTVLGGAGTVAGILSTVDFENDLFDQPWRVLWIVCSAVLMLGLFYRLRR